MGFACGRHSLFIRPHWYRFGPGRPATSSPYRPGPDIRPRRQDGLQRRALHLAPPFLLDDYIPRYQMLAEVDAAKKRSRAYAHLSNCNLCPRLCGVNRYETTGMCLVGDTAKVNVIAPHFGEEPCIQGHNGSGSVFFSMCNLRCSFCQNHDISHQPKGMDLAPEELAEWFIKLQQVGNVHNINLITPEHVVPQVALAILHARDFGLRLPIIYNTSAFDSLASLELLDGLVDIYLPDFKVWEPATSKRLLKADDYAATARESIKAMHAQVGDLCFTGDGIAKSGVLVRHLVMPGLEEEGARIMRWLAEEVSRDMFVNIMEQYHPDAHVGKPRRRTAKGREKSASEGLDRDESHTRDDGLGAASTASASSDTKEQNENNDIHDKNDKHDKKTPEEVRYADINRAVTTHEISAVRKAAEAAGLWRFCDPPRHGGFNI